MPFQIDLDLGASGDSASETLYIGILHCFCFEASEMFRGLQNFAWLYSHGQKFTFTC